jgi:hypothetical protein
MELYKDDYSIIAHDADTGILTLTWTARTANMTDEDFKRTNMEFAEQSVKQNSPRLLVDVREFGHTFGAALGEWRLKNIIPKYHQAGVEKFAFVHGSDFPEPPDGKKEEGENFVSRHFASEAGAKAWLMA